MSGLSKYDGKDKRRQRMRNHIARDLRTSKYQPRVVPDKKRIDNEDGSYYFEDYQYLDDLKDEDDYR